MHPFLAIIGRKVTPAVSGGSIFVSDTFTGTNGTDLIAHTGEIGATWAKVSGATGVIKITNNKAKGDSGGMSLYYASGIADTNEYDVEADYFVVSMVDLPGIGGRIDPVTDSGYYLTLNPSFVQWSLIARVSGSDTLLGNFSDTVTSGSGRHLKLEIRNAAKKVFIDGVEAIISADNSIAGIGRAGMRYANSDWGFGTTGRTFDNFVATNA